MGEVSLLDPRALNSKSNIHSPFQLKIAAELKEWLQKHNLESVEKALLQLGVESLEDLAMVETEVVYPHHAGPTVTVR